MTARRRHEGVVWRALATAGMPDARERWEALSPEFRRYGFPVLIAAVVILVAWPAWRAPDPGLVVLLAIAYALYVAPRPLRRFALPATVLVLAALYPFYVDKLFAVPVINSFPSMTTVVPITIFVMMAIGLNIVVGYAGLLDLGYVAFYATGAYVAAWLASPIFSGSSFSFGGVDIAPGFPGVHVSLWLVLLAAGCLTAIFGVLIGLPTLRLRGDYLAIVTLGFGEILPQVAKNGDSIFGINLTNGSQGITPVDTPGFGSWSFLDATGTYVNAISLFYWGGLALVLFTIFCSARMRDSRLGRAWIAIREDETAAAAMGVPLMRTKTWSYAAGAFFGGIAGSWYASYKSGVFPDDFFFNFSVFVLCMVILGGMGNIWGVVAGAIFLSYLDLEGLGNIGAWFNDTFSTSVDVPKYKFGIYGLIIVAVMLFKPHGLLPEARRKLEFEVAEADAAAAEGKPL